MIKPIKRLARTIDPRPNLSDLAAAPKNCTGEDFAFPTADRVALPEAAGFAAPVPAAGLAVLSPEDATASVEVARVEVAGSPALWRTIEDGWA